MKIAHEFERVLGYTTCSDIEGAFLKNKILRNLVLDAGTAKISDWDAMFLNIERVVKTIFCVRLSLEELEIKKKTPEVSKSLVKKGNSFDFNYDEFIQKLSSRGVSEPQIVQVKQRSCEWFSKIEEEEARFAGRGHDYVEVLSWVIKKFGGNSKVADSIDAIMILLTPDAVQDIVAPFDK